MKITVCARNVSFFTYELFFSVTLPTPRDEHAVLAIFAGVVIFEILYQMTTENARGKRVTDSVNSISLVTTRASSYCNTTLYRLLHFYLKLTNLSKNITSFAYYH